MYDVVRRCEPARNRGTSIIGVGVVMADRRRWTTLSYSMVRATGRSTMGSKADGMGRVLRKADRNARAV